MAEMYDLIVVGGGPGGLMAAQTAASGGLDVLLIEQKTSITSIGRTCVSGLIIEPDCNRETVTVEGEQIVQQNSLGLRRKGLN